MTNYEIWPEDHTMPPVVHKRTTGRSKGQVVTAESITFRFAIKDATGRVLYRTTNIGTADQILASLETYTLHKAA